MVTLHCRTALGALSLLLFTALLAACGSDSGTDSGASDSPATSGADATAPQDSRPDQTGSGTARPSSDDVLSDPPRTSSGRGSSIRPPSTGTEPPATGGPSGTLPPPSSGTGPSDSGPSDGPSDGPSASTPSESGAPSQTGEPTASNVLPPGVTLSDYLPCDSDIDCPVGFGNCVRTVSFNRVDRDGQSSVAVSELTGPDGPTGICTLLCNADPGVCDRLALSDGRGTPVRWQCQLIATGADPYGQDPLDPSGPVEISEMEAGMPFAAICRPPFGLSPEVPNDLCRVCNAADPCPTSVCFDPLHGRVLDGDGDGLCAIPCNDAPCPAGFRCEDVEGAGDHCIPLLDTCTSCLDLDGDGYGTGHCGPGNAITPHDCDDRRADIYFSTEDPLHPFPEVCGPVDYNCNGIPDDIEQWGNPAVTRLVEVDGEPLDVLAHCAACDDACGRPVPNGQEVCVPDPSTGSGFACVIACDTIDDPDFGTVPAFANCDGSVATGCETSIDDPAFLWWPDVDGDGFGDRFATPIFACTPEDVPENHVNNNLDCDDTDPDANPNAEEVCNGRDMNCDGTIDTPAAISELGAPCNIGAPLACGAGLLVCGGEEGLVCEPVPGSPTPVGDPVCPGYWPECDPDESRSAAELRALLGTPCDVEGQLGACSIGEWQCRDDGPPFCVQTTQPGPDRPTPPDTDIEDPRLRDTSCDGIDGDLARAVFVTVGGLPGAPGTPTQPTNDLQRAIALANDTGRDVYIGAGIYPISQPIVLRNGTSLYGGFTDLTWTTRDASPNATTIRHDGTTVSRSAVAFRMENITDRTELQRILIEVREPDAPGSSAVGIRCIACPGLVLDHVTLNIAGGTAGSGFFQGTDTPAGVPDGASSSPVACEAEPGTRPVNSLPVPQGPACPGTVIAGSGGQGGASATRTAGSLPGTAGGAGQPGSIAGGTRGGSNGGNGGSGRGGRAGVAGSAPGGLALNGGIPMSRSGSAGSVGGGGSGGGGGGGSSLATSSITGIVASVPGTHGSSGACGGRGGAGGQSGGSSYGLVLARSDGFTARQVTISVGPGGAGGRGQDGGTGGVGGARVQGGFGFCTVPPWNGDPSGAGGAGGSGGGGGGGAGGGGGNSIGILRDGQTSFNVQDFNITVSMTPALGGEGGAGGAGGAPSSGAETHARGATGQRGENGPPGISREAFETDLL